MKTPRDFLLERHQAAAPKLDAVRRTVLAGLNHKDTKARSWTDDFVSLCLGGSNKLWRELIWPCRRIWTGLAAVWLLILAVNFSLRDTVSGVTGQPVRSPVVVISWQTQQHWMNELLAERTVPPETDRPRKIVPGPRTENFAPAAV